MNKVYLMAIGANFCFALGSQVFTYYSRKISSAWMNCFKAVIAALACSIFVAISGEWYGLNGYHTALFLFSGALGLGLGDIFLLRAFSEMGPGRTLILFGFQPIVLGVLSYFLLGQTLDTQKMLAIVFCILCLITFSVESFKSKGHWELSGLLFAGTGMLLDAIGILVTRKAFDLYPSVGAIEGNMYRCFGAVLFFVIFSRFKPIYFVAKFKEQKNKGKIILIAGSLIGTFLSLSLYLSAIQTGHLASLSGIAITGAIFSATMECIIERKRPSKYLMMAFVFFLIGMKIIFS